MFEVYGNLTMSNGNKISWLRFVDKTHKNPIEIAIHNVIAQHGGEEFVSQIEVEKVVK